MHSWFAFFNTDGKQFRCSVFTFVQYNTCKEKPWLNVDKIVAYLSQPTKLRYFLFDNYIGIAEFLPDYRVTKDVIFKVVFSRKSSTTPYHPMRNRMVESDNQNRLIMVGILEDKQKEKNENCSLPHWSTHLSLPCMTALAIHQISFEGHSRPAMDAYLYMSHDKLFAVALVYSFIITLHDSIGYSPIPF